jgi:hypothetical protein
MERSSLKHGDVGMLSNHLVCQASPLNILVCRSISFVGSSCKPLLTRLVLYNFDAGNDMRYRKYLKDVRFSLCETLIRSIESNKFSLHRKRESASYSLFDFLTSF